LPSRVGDLFEREERCTDVAGEYEAVAAYVAEHATPSS
jgi:threonine synthase